VPASAAPRRTARATTASSATTTAVQIAKAPGAIRKPKHWRIEQPVDLLEVGTKEIRLRRGLVLKHFRVRDVICRWDVM